MPTTVTGTAYTEFSTVLAMGDQALYAIPNSQIGGTDVPMIIYCHGDGGEWNQLATTAAWTGWRTWLLDHGWGWVESAGAGISTWGSPAARSSYEQAYTWMASQVDVGPLVVLGRSMGGLVSTWLYTQSPVVSPVADGLIVSSGVLDLEYRYFSYATTTKREDMRAAYGAADDADWRVKTVGHDPMLFPLDVWNGKKILNLVGTADDNTVPAVNAYALRARFAGRPALDLLTVRNGGDHESSNGTFYEVGAMAAFVNQVTYTPPNTAFTASGLYRLANDGALYSLTLA